MRSCLSIFRPKQIPFNKAKHGDGFSLRLRLRYKAARVGGVRQNQIIEEACRIYIQTETLRKILYKMVYMKTLKKVWIFLSHQLSLQNLMSLGCYWKTIATSESLFD